MLNLKITLRSGRTFENISEVKVSFDFYALDNAVDIKTFSYVNDASALSAVETWDSRLRRIKSSNGDLKTLADRKSVV